MVVLNVTLGSNARARPAITFRPGFQKNRALHQRRRQFENLKDFRRVNDHASY